MDRDSELSREIKEIRQELRDIKVLCEKMSNHINFVDNVYTKVRAPFCWVLNRVNHLRGANSVELKEIEPRKKPPPPPSLPDPR